MLLGGSAEQAETALQALDRSLNRTLRPRRRSGDDALDRVLDPLAELGGLRTLSTTRRPNRGEREGTTHGREDQRQAKLTLRPSSLGAW